MDVFGCGSVLVLVLFFWFGYVVFVGLWLFFCGFVFWVGEWFVGGLLCVLFGGDFSVGVVV